MSITDTNLDNDSSRNLLEVHGRLYWAYRNAIGWKLLKGAYRPKDMRFDNYVIWFLTIVALTFPFTVNVFDDIEIIVVLSEVVIFFIYCQLANYSFETTYKEELHQLGVNGLESAQPQRHVRTLLHHYWFYERINLEFAVSDADLEKVIEFIDTNNRPNYFAEYLKHPWLLLFLGLFFNKLSEIVKAIPTDWENMLVFAFLAFAIFHWGWMFYYMGVNAKQDDWAFKRALRWVLLRRRYEQGTATSTVAS